MGYLRRFNIPIMWRRRYRGGGAPAVTNGILLENATDFLMLEDGVSFLLQE